MNLSIYEKIKLIFGIVSNPFLIVLDKLGMKSEIKYSLRNGQRVFCRAKSTDINETVVVMSGYEYPKSFFENVSPNPVVLDCGGNIGLFSLYIKSLFQNSRIYAFEPIKENVFQFKKNILENNITNVILVEKGISDKNGEVFFELKGNDFDAVKEVEKENENTQKVEVVGLEEFVRENNINMIDILKVDIEGGEYSLFENTIDFLSKRVLKIVVEYHSNVKSDGREFLLNLFSKNNFNLSCEKDHILVFDNTTQNMNSGNQNDYLSVIVPNRNSAHLMKDFFQSALKSTYKNFEIVVNDDVVSTDNLKELCEEYNSKGLKTVYIKENISMAQGRKSAAMHAKGNILIHLDSDMRISPLLFEECAEKIRNGYDALVIPEESYGEGFWAQVKWLEKECYQGVEFMESLRVVKKVIYQKLGGHNEKMVFSEDKDFDIRVRESGYKIGRTENGLRHYEGKQELWKTMKKKMGYSNTSDIFASVHKKHFSLQANIFLRYYIFLKNIKYLFTYPHVYIGLWFLKTCEYFAAFLGMIKKKINL